MAKQGQRRARPSPPLDDADDGFFVDAAPVHATSERPGGERDGPARAAERRREQGRAPVPVGPPDTRTSLPERQEAARPAATSPSPPLGMINGGVSGTLSCIRGPEAGLSLSLAPGSYTVGRARENDLVLRDIAASRKHLRIDVDGQVARLIDLGSGNGTKLNGKRAGESELRHGDIIEIGASALVYAAPGRAATPDVQGVDPQARVVAAADELARELSHKLRFGDGDGLDGHVATTRALPSADVRGVKDAAPRDKAPKRSPDRLWNETFTNLPLSEVIADDQRLQSTGVQHEREPKRRPAGPPPAPALKRPMGPVGTTALDDNVDDHDVVAHDDADDEHAALVEQVAPPSRGSFILSAVVSAGVVVLLCGVGYGVWSLVSGRPASPPAAAHDTASSEYLAAINRAQDAITRQDWAGVREYTIVALQVKPNDPLALTYQREADKKLAATATSSEADQARDGPPAPSPPISDGATTQAPPKVATSPSSPRVAPPSSPVGVIAAKPKPRPRSDPPVVRAAKKKGLSEDEAKALFERAIDAFRARDTDGGCAVLQQIADRASEEGSWRNKAENLARKRCND